MRGTPLDHCCGRVAKLALERRRVQRRCPRAPTPEPGKGRRPKNRQSQRRKVFLPGCSVFSLSWPACAGAFLVPGRWFSGPAPSGSCLLLFRLVFLSTGRGRHVPAPSGRDVGSSAGAPTQEPALSRYPSLRSIFLPFLCDVRVGVARACFRVHGHMYHLRPPLLWPCLFAWFSSSSSSFSSCVLFFSGAGISRDVYFSDCFSICLFLFVVQNAVLISCNGRIIVAYCPALNASTQNEQTLQVLRLKDFSRVGITLIA